MPPRRPRPRPTRQPPRSRRESRRGSPATHGTPRTAGRLPPCPRPRRPTPPRGRRGPRPRPTTSRTSSRRMRPTPSSPSTRDRNRRSDGPDATTAVAGNVPGDDANEPRAPPGTGRTDSPSPGRRSSPRGTRRRTRNFPGTTLRTTTETRRAVLPPPPLPPPPPKPLPRKRRAPPRWSRSTSRRLRARERRRVRVRRWERPLPVAVSRLRRSPRGRRRRPPARVHRGAGCGPVLRRGQHGQAPAHLRVLGAPAGGRAVRPRDGARRHPRHDAAPAQHAPVCRRGARRLAGVLHARGRAQAVPDARRGGLLCVRR